VTENGRGPISVALVGRVLGPLLFLLVTLAPAASLAGPARQTAAVLLWMAVWWMTEAAPLAITALLPLVLFPVLGVRGVHQVAPNYANQMIFLFLGGFVLALAVERSGLHRRLALAILAAVGDSPRRLVWGFLLATAALSMWLSNTATALMLLPIAASVASRIGGGEKAPPRLMLAVAYGASIGGIGTLVGTPPNLVLAGMAPNLVPDLEPLSFGGWMLFGVPFVLLFLPVVGLLLGRGLPGRAAEESGVRAERAALGPLGRAERRVAVLFAVTAVAWVTRTGLDFGAVGIPGWGDVLAHWGAISDPALITDAVPAIAAAVLATLLPADEIGGRRMLSWDEIQHGVPWGVLLLFGGGFAIADGVSVSGLDQWLAASLRGLAALPLPLVIFCICLITTSATELTSNTATATLLMPVMAALAAVLGVHPYLLMVPATLSASCAFMLPVATPPNAIVIGSGRVSARDLFREGLWLNLAGAALTTIAVLTLGRLVLPM
jgi:sodium-dependent dicarboxylate transporter 2/3/5